MALPSNWSLVTVKGKFVNLDGSATSGKITFTPSGTVWIDGAADTIIRRVPLTAQLNAYGAFSIQLPASDDSDINPTGFTYTVVEPTGRTYNITVPASAGTIELSDIVPTSAADPGYVQVIGGGGGSGGVPDDGSVTNAKVATGAAISLDKTADSATRLALTSAQSTKLAGIATGATANSSDATLLARANHTGTQAISTLATTGTASSSTYLRGDGAWATPAGGSATETVHAVGNSGTALTVNPTVTGPYKTITLNGNCTLTFAGATAGQVTRMDLQLTQDATGSRTVTWPSSVKWSGGTPTLSTTAGAIDQFTFWSPDGGTTWFGAVAGKGFA